LLEELDDCAIAARSIGTRPTSLDDLLAIDIVALIEEIAQVSSS
jgi:hypothetical protein